MKTGVRTRARILCAFFIAIALLLVLRLYFVQIVHGDEYAREAMGQYVENAPGAQERGDIFFTTKDGALVSAAVMESGWRIAIDPEEIDDPEAYYSALNAITPIDRDRFMASAAKKSDPYEEVAFRLPDTVAASIRELDLPGVLLVSDEWRSYPGGELASQVVGFTGYLGHAVSKVGVYGLERQYDSTLSIPSSDLYVNPFAEIFTNMEAALATDPTAHEGSVITSIEPTVQAQLEKTLEEVMKTYTPQLAGGIVMDPHTGEVIAMGARPDFDPNTYNIVDDPSVYTNPLVEGRYELGSIMKPLTMAAAIDAGAVTPETTYDDTGCVERSGARVCNYDFRARGVIPMQEILNQSLNVGATFLADTMGHPTMTRYFKAYGFGEPTGIDLPNEVTGDISPLGDGHGPDVNYAAASFGQGMAVSPIEMTRALSVLANDGVLPSPHVVTGIRYASGIERSISATSGPQVLKPETARTVTNMLVTVYDDAMLGGTIKQEHYSIASKTGTAQIAAPGGGYYPDRYLHSYFGYFPASDPKFIVFLFVVEPHGVEYASASLALPFVDIAKFIINYYDLPPDR